MRDAVAYYRVSTRRQGKSGLGLDAQKEAVEDYQRLYSTRIEREYFEVESGKRNDRRVLKGAIRYCKKRGLTLLIAKVDRLTRDVLFMALLIQSKVHIIAADKPYNTILDLLEDAIHAQREGERISQRTKAALQAAKKRGVVLGSFSKVLAERNRKRSSDFAEKMEPVIKKLKSEGFESIQALTNELNNRKIRTYRPGSKWHKSTVFNVVKRIRLNSTTRFQSMYPMT